MGQDRGGGIRVFGTGGGGAEDGGGAGGREDGAGDGAGEVEEAAVVGCADVGGEGGGVEEED